MKQDIQELWTLCEPYVQHVGFELVELQSGREAGGWVVRLYIDRPQAPGNVDDAAAALLAEGMVSLEDCERVSRDISAALDVADVIPTAYALEVSSPGLDRPLRRERDFARFAGEKVRIRLASGVEGRRNFSGTLHGASDGAAEVECDGKRYRIPITDVVKANLVPDWDKEFSKESKRSASSSTGVGQGATTTKATAVTTDETAESPLAPAVRWGESEAPSGVRIARGGRSAPLRSPHEKRHFKRSAS
jgi:ribosome maturation factor RimP